jgi:hypothetical protein
VGLLLHQTNHMKKCSCKGRIRTSTGQLDARQRARAGGQPQSTLPLSCNPYPRDKRAWLPISSPHNVNLKKL